MQLFRKPLRVKFLILIIAITTACTVYTGQLIAADPPTKPKAEKKSSLANQFNVPVPVGEPVRGIHVPHYTEEGKLAMEFDAEMAQKLDDKNIEMRNLFIQFFDEEKAPMKVALAESVFNLETEVLTSKDRVVIQRDDFQVEGDSGEFNVRDRLGKIAGNIKMIIYSKEEIKP